MCFSVKEYTKDGIERCSIQLHFESQYSVVKLKTNNISKLKAFFQVILHFKWGMPDLHRYPIKPLAGHQGQRNPFVYHQSCVQN